MMYLDGALYGASFIVCVALGPHLRKIEDPTGRRDYGAMIGMTIAFMICGKYIFNCMAMVFINVCIMKYCNKQVVHKISLLYTWAHLILIHLFLSKNKYLIWYHQTLALRLVGLSFEIHLTDCARKNILTSSVKLRSEPSSEEQTVDPAPIDIIGYAFFFAGVHKGPYFRWSVLKNYLETPEPPDFRYESESKLANIIGWSISYVYLVLCGKFTTDVYYDWKFYSERHADHRYIYNLSQLLLFYLQSQILANLSACTFTECGFGGYSATTKPIPGFGPTSLPKPQSEASTSTEEYSFKMMQQINTKTLIIGPHMTDTLRSWDMPSRYFFWSYIYKTLIHGHESVRNAMSYIIFILWSGPSFPNIVLGGTLWLHCYFEKETTHMFSMRDETMKSPKDVGYSIMRVLCLVYLTPCLVINDTSVLLRYYNSIYWSYHCLLVLIGVGIVALRRLRFGNRLL